MATRRILSGIQPTGVPHLGNYLGAIANWANLQRVSVEPALFMIADLHAMTVPFDPRRLPDRCRQTAAALLACGIDPSASIIFRQSAVREHTELAWVLGTMTPLGWLERMTQFKDKAGQLKRSPSRAAGADGPDSSKAVPSRSFSTDAAVAPAPLAALRRADLQRNPGLGLLSYPVLQAADILLYCATGVPVGEDQRQHLELSRDIANSFNFSFAREDGAGFRFPLPETLSVPGRATRVMSLRDGLKKMSKSDPTEGSRIDLDDSPDTIRLKIRRAKTDSEPGLEFDPLRRPERSNLIALFAAVRDTSTEAIVDEFRSKNTLEFKEALADAVVARIGPIGAEYSRLLADRTHLDAVLAAGADRARAIAADTMRAVRDLTGLAER